MDIPQPFPHQIVGTQWLRNWDERALLLADTMGLGKTRQACDAIGDRALVVCPPPLKHNWYDEIGKWRPDLKPVIMMGMHEVARFKWPSSGEVVIVGYNQVPDWMEQPRNVRKTDPNADKKRKANKAHRAELKRQYRLVEKEGWADDLLLIADEVQYVKNPKSSRARRFRTLSALCAYTRMLTGTPMPRGKPSDLYGILWACVLENVVFHNLPHFETVSGIKGGVSPSKSFHTLLETHMLRRHKDEVAADLPPKLFRTVTVPLDRATNSKLEALNPELVAAIKRATTPAELDKIRGMPGFAEFARTRQAIAHARIPGLMEHVQLAEENETPTLVFSAHRDPVLAFEGREGWAVIHGGVPLAERQEIVRNQKQYKGIAITIKSGGAGLTLTHFSNVVFVDLDWDITWNEQAQDRIHRYGQTADFCVYTILTSDTAIDRLITEKLARAAFNIDIVIEGK